MKSILTILAVLAYIALIASDFYWQPELLLIPATLVLSALLMLGVPTLVRRKASSGPLPLPATFITATALLAVLFFALRATLPENLHAYGFISLVGLNGVFYLVALLILRKEKQG
ncbi:hypothetical protein [Desulfohalovibrio reitneri]|uniref:hypothetical protein n=1 Tax=Desulfohalovibrio reitneri TaxID=1307759 RepID=UPI0004A6FCF7|nr:hypothetical protein [Desulfohalovibrio reitneri]